MKRKSAFSFVLLFAFLATHNPPSALAQDTPPNILLILCDDLGIGDVSAYNPDHGKIPTPHINRLAEQGVMFTDAHSGSSVCTPTRYGLLTGRYSWRTRLQKGVVQGFDQCLIDEQRPTLGGFLQDQGYETAVIGKWHLNMRFFKEEQELKGKPLKFTPPVGATSPDGPTHRGFDYFFGIHHARSMKAIMENDRVIRHSPVIDFLPSCEKKATEFIKQHADSEKPFFLYLPLGSPHTPIVPTPEWQGKSGLGPYADFVMQTDHVVGQILKSLETHGMSDHTIVIFSSDNGCSRVVNIPRLREQGHDVSAGFRGSKADTWDGGHRIPLIIKWPGSTKAKTTCDHLVGLQDIFATIAEGLSFPMPKQGCEDSVSFLSSLSLDSEQSSRTHLIHHSVSGHFAIRTPDWKLILAKASGGWSQPNEKKAAASAPEGQLYDMRVDSGEQNNLFEQRPEIVNELLERLKSDVKNGRTTPGPTSKNDIQTIKLWKSK